MANRERPALTARMADLLESVAWALDVLVPELPHVERHASQPTWPLSTREALMPAADRLAGEARALVAEYRRRKG